MHRFEQNWIDLSHINNLEYKCGYCNNNVAPSFGYLARNKYGVSRAYIYICPKCNKPTFIDDNNIQTPGTKYGEEVAKLPIEIKRLYDEARNSYSVNSFNGVAMLCRKLLMNIAVSLDAEKNKSFVFYVDFLSDNNYIPRKAKSWVDRIRKAGNIATHEIEDFTKEQAIDILKFTSSLLKNIYEFQIDDEEA